MDGTGMQVREARKDDYHRLANLTHFEEHVHRHLDWKPALEWIGSVPFLLAERNNELLAALACPPDPQDVAWLRLFAVTAGFSPLMFWRKLWSQAEQQLAGLGIREAYALALQDWFTQLLTTESFEHVQDVVVLALAAYPDHSPHSSDQVRVRSMTIEDLPEVCKVDNRAFGMEWRNSLDALGLAFQQSSVATVAELNGELVGYQISTGGPMGGHLARLAVLPERQGHGIGAKLVYDLLERFQNYGIPRVTVNTQADNLASLSIYHKCGFQYTGEVYPVFRLIPWKGTKGTTVP